eukprot:CAMPEP_0184688768 /NCGR_PEP_ID=MMETSP0312-20130426/30277_1 /TAXON_ID=31354 /ORGANISM="Compsopogon coeruleus, Strain SAG 36.94" /LENGTH=582 /DNA_ID=CAMNT_0027146033 /DNA_START=60 /DNA_END=1805 /DNA_ORIENTATION=+
MSANYMGSLEDFQSLLNQTVLGDPIKLQTTDEYLWVVVVGALLAFFMAWGIGANDVANAFATSVGAGSIKLKWACLMAAICEFGGALLLGGEVTDTVRGKILKPENFDPAQGGALNGPEVFMCGSMLVLLVAGLWLLIATYFEMPVSTTHSIIGSYIGFGFAYRGAGAINWLTDGSGLDKLKGVVGIIASWFISPLFSAILAILVFLLVRHVVLRRKNPVRAALLFGPLFYALAVIVVVFFIVYKGDARNGWKDTSLGTGIGIAFGVGIGCALLSWWLLVPPQRRFVEKWERDQLELLKSGPREELSKLGMLKKIGINVEYDIQLDEKVSRIHDAAEKFDPKAERCFAWMQVFTAAFDSFAHGANDVANAIAPFATIYSLYESGGILSTTKVSKNGSSPLDLFSADGTTIVGSVDAGEPIPDGKSFCGTFNDTAYYRCSNPLGIAITNNPGIGNSMNFSLYSLDETSETYLFSENAACFTNCVAGTVAAVSSAKQPVQEWILALGGAGIVAGLSMWGYRIILAIGSKLTKITASRGFSIEVGAAITVLIASKIGLPVSTTHCQVGATVGVGLIEGKTDTLNW